MNHKTVGIGEVARKCNVTEKQLRYWGDAGYINPETVVCGERTYRRYSQADIELVSEIKRLLDLGYMLANAARRARANIEENKNEKKDSQ